MGDHYLIFPPIKTPEEALWLHYYLALDLEMDPEEEFHGDGRELETEAKTDFKKAGFEAKAGISNQPRDSNP